jgi:hypothetical protein
MIDSNKQKQIDLKFEIFINAQAKAIEIAKWLEGEQTNKDPGENFIKHWIRTNAKNFSLNWENSQCKQCKSADCRYNAKKHCKNFCLDQELMRLYENIRSESSK